MTVLVTVLVLSLLIELAAWLCGQPWAPDSLLWSKRDKEIAAMRKKSIDLKRQLDATSAVDNFVRWAKLSRSLAQLDEQIGASRALNIQTHVYFFF